MVLIVFLQNTILLLLCCRDNRIGIIRKILQALFFYHKDIFSVDFRLSDVIYFSD